MAIRNMILSSNLPNFKYVKEPVRFYKFLSEFLPPASVAEKGGLMVSCIRPPVPT